MNIKTKDLKVCYSQLVVNMETKQGLVLINEFSGEFGKVVQLYVKEEPFLIVGDKNKLNHGLILDKVLEQMDVPFERVRLFDNTCHAERVGQLYRAVGMGYADFYRDKELIFLHGFSTGYKSETNKPFNIDREHIKKVQPYIRDYKLMVD